MIDELEHKIADTAHLNSKLILLIGPPRSGKTALLGQLSHRMNVPVLNGGLTLGRALLGLPRTRRHLQVSELFKNLADTAASHGLLLVDNMELMFDRALRVSPLDVLRAQGKSAIARFDADLLGPAFPASADEIGTFVRTKYLERAKDVLVVNLIKAIISMPFGAERPKYASKTRTLAVILREISKAKTAIYDAVMPAYVAEKVEQVPGEVLLSICPYLENDPRIWDWLKEPDRTRIRRLLETSTADELKEHAALDAFAIPAMAGVLLDRFNGFDDPTKINIIAEHPRKELVGHGIALFQQAGSFRYAEQLGKSVILPLAPCFTAADLKVVLEVAADNGQIWDAAETPDILEQLFDQTKPVLPASRPHWQAFLASLAGRQILRYAGLQERLDQNP